MAPRTSSRRASREDISQEELPSRLGRKRESEEELAAGDTRSKRTRSSRSKEPADRRGRSTKAFDSCDVCSLDPDNPDDLAKFLGFSTFRSTKGIKVPGNKVGAVDLKRKRREYTQMLHRKKLYEIPMTKQQLAEKEAADQMKMQE